MSAGPISRREILILGAAAFLSGMGSAVAVVRRRPGGRLAGASAASPAAAPSTPVPAPVPAAAVVPAPPASAVEPPQERVLEVICRGAWGATPAGEGRPHEVQWITIHHSGVTFTDNRAAPSRFRGHQRAHERKGWIDIAYHLMIDQNGNVYEGRLPRIEGDSSTDYDLAGHLLVMCEGNFDEQDVSPAQFAALARVVAWAQQQYGLGADRVKAHRDLAQTACPGESLYQRVVHDLEAAVTSQLRHVRWRQELLCGQDATSRVQAIKRGEH